MTKSNAPFRGCLCGDGCISAYDNQPCDCFCDGDIDGKHHYDYLDDTPPEQSPACDRCGRPRLPTVHRGMNECEFCGNTDHTRLLWSEQEQREVRCCERHSCLLAPHPGADQGGTP